MLSEIEPVPVAHRVGVGETEEEGKLERLELALAQRVVVWVAVRLLLPLGVTQGVAEADCEVL